MNRSVSLRRRDSESGSANSGRPPSAPPATERCPVCLSARAEFHARGTDRLFRATTGSFRLMRCTACGSLFQDPLPGEDELAAFYPTSYWWAPQGGAGALLDRAAQAWREFVCMDHVRFLERCARRAGCGKRLLDIGCGSGLFLHLARRRGFDVCGMDVSGEAVALARARFGLEVRQGGAGEPLWEGGSFDFVTMFHVLEHLREPASALDYARGLLRPSGSLIVQVPNVRSLQARLFGARWYGLDLPRHLAQFSPEGLRLLLERAGFGIVRRARFSLRDNPAAIASSLAVRLDPIGRQSRLPHEPPLARGIFTLAYFSLFLASILPAMLEGVLGFGGTVWVEARQKDAGGRG